MNALDWMHWIGCTGLGARLLDALDWMQIPVEELEELLEFGIVAKAKTKVHRR